MARKPSWQRLAPQIIYAGHPDVDLLPIEPPKPSERIGAFKLRAEEAGDTLFLLLCREADDEIDADEYMRRLDRAVRDITSVQNALQDRCLTDAESHPEASLPTILGGGEGRVVRIDLGNDWIEVWLGASDADGRVSGRMLTNLRSSRDNDDRFNTAMDAIEALILAHACAGLDVRDPRYIDGIRTCLEACAAPL